LKNYLNMMKASSRYLCSPLKNRWSQSLNSSMKQSKRWCQASVNANRIQKENGWAYTGCKKCNKKVNVVESKTSSSNGKNKVTFYCEDDGVVQVASRYKVIMRIIDQSGSAPIVFFNTMEGFLDKEDDDDGFTTPVNQVKSANFIDPSINRVLDMQTPTSGNEGSGSGGSSGTIKRRLKSTNDNDSDINCVIDMDTSNSGNKGSGSGGSSGSKECLLTWMKSTARKMKNGAATRLLNWSP
nr:hypothetical protein [Tanacetum cinerariifolium]